MTISLWSYDDKLHRTKTLILRNDTFQTKKEFVLDFAEQQLREEDKSIIP